MDNLGCISASENHCSNSDGNADTNFVLHSPAVSTNSAIGKNKLTKEAGRSSSSALKKLTSQIRKPTRRKTSPINWFPRKKVDSYLNRKIKMLQEVDGMNLTLDETLGDSCPHYSRVLREKMAAREAAHKAMEARRAALVEASWCRILRAARIPSEDAEAQLLKAEKSAMEAFDAAQALGVIMFDLPNCPKKHCQIETSSDNGEGSSTLTVTASFETAFEVDKEVAAAVKTAFTRLANCPSFSSKYEFKELLRKISENPNTDESHQDSSELSSGYESEPGSELDSVSRNSDFNFQDLDSKMPFLGESQRRQSLDNKIKLVDVMIERLKCLQEDELSSLATIVATYGLNAALAEVQGIKLHNPEYTSAINFPARRMSSLGLEKLAGLDRKMRKKQVEPELPSLDKFLVKHMTKLEKEIWEAKKTQTNETASGTDSSRKSVDGTPSETIPDLGSILVKNYSKLEKDIQEAKIKSRNEAPKVPSGMSNRQKDHSEVPSLDKLLVKHVSRLEKEVQEAKKRTINAKKSSQVTTSCSDEALDNKENKNSNKEEIKGRISSSDGPGTNDGLEKILIKPIHRLEREKMQVLSLGNHDESYRPKKNHGATNVTDCESLDKVLVKRVSRLEKEKMKINSGEERGEIKRNHRNNIHWGETNEEGGGLDRILVKHKSRLEREKMAAAQQPENQVGHSSARREARERELQEAWGGLSLGNSMKPRLSTEDGGGLDQNLVKHKSRLEQEKVLAAQQQENNTGTPSMSRREARDRELQQAWGGLSLGNSMKPRLSKLERDKAAWTKAEEEERRQAMKAI